jgi:WD40 repeat protein/uncharacterized caspase-like protein
MTRLWLSIAIVLALQAHVSAADAPVGPVLQPQVGHGGDVTRIALSADGTLAATSSEDAVIQWDVRSGMEVRRWAGMSAGGEHFGEVPEIQFASDGSLIVVNSVMATALDVTTGSKRWATPLLDVRFNSPWYLRVSDDAARLAYAIRGASKGTAAMVIDREHGTPKVLDGKDSEITALALSPDGSQLITGTELGEVRLWDIATATYRSLRIGAKVEDVTFVRGTTLALAATSETILVLELRSGGILATSQVPGSVLQSVRLDPITNTVQAIGLAKNRGGYSHVIWRLAAPKELARGAHVPLGLPREILRLPEASGKLRWVAVAERTPLAFLTAAGRGTIAAMDEGVVVTRFGFSPMRHEPAPTAIALSTDGAIALLAREGRLERLDLATLERRPIMQLQDGQSSAGTKALASCGSSVLVVQDHRVRIIDDLNAPHPTLRTLVDGSYSAAAFDPTCKLIAISHNDLNHGSAVEIHRRDGSLVAQLELPNRAFLNLMKSFELRRSGPRRYRINDALELYGDLEVIGGTAVSADGRNSVTRSSARDIDVVKPGGLKLTALAYAFVSGVALASDGRTVTVVNAFGRRQEQWDLETKRMLTESEAPSSFVVALRPDARLAIAGAGPDMMVWDPALKESKGMPLSGHTGKVERVALAGRGRRALSYAADGTLRLWNLDSRDSVAIVTIGDEWVEWTPDGLFAASPRGIGLLAIVEAGRAHGIERLAPQLERPDVILGRLGLATEEIRHGLALRAEHRRSQAGAISGPAVTSAPRVEIAGSRRDGAFLELELRFTAGGAPLASYELAVNGVPASKPVPVGGDRATARVELSYGDNRIEVRARDTRGVESFEAIAAAHREGIAQPDLYIVSLGVSRYKRDELRLRYAHRDAHELAMVMLALRGRGFREVRATTFEDEAVTPAAIDEARRFVASARIHDVVVIFISGHGVLDVASGHYYYLPSGADPDQLAATAITFEALESLSFATPSRRKLVLMDTCESGQMEPAALARIEDAVRAGNYPKRVRRRPRTAAMTYQVPAAYRHSHLFRDAFRRSGAVVLSSSRGDEDSYEAPRLRAGLFAHEVLAALRDPGTDRDGDGQISAAELERRVASGVVRLSGGRQHPSMDRDNPLAQFVLPAAERAAMRPSRLERHRPPGCACTSGDAPDAGCGVILLAIVAAVRRASASRRRSVRT